MAVTCNWCVKLVILFSRLLSVKSQQKINVGGVVYNFPLKLALLYDGYCLGGNNCDASNVMSGDIAMYMLAGWPLFLQDIRGDPGLKLFQNTTIIAANTMSSYGIGLSSEIFLRETSNANLNQDIVAIIGGQQSCDTSSAVSTANNKLMINFNCDTSQSSKTALGLSTAINLYPNQDSYAKAVIALLKKYHYTRVAILTFCCSVIDQPLLQAMQTGNVTVVKYLSVQNSELYMPDRTKSVALFAKFVIDTYIKTRAYIVYGERIRNENVHYLLDTMQRFGLLQTGEYFVISIVQPSKKLTDVYMTTDEFAKLYLTVREDPKSYRNLMRRPSKKRIYQSYRTTAIIAQTPPVQNDLTTFLDRMTNVYYDPPCPPLCINYTELNLSPETPRKDLMYSEAAMLYDGLMLYCKVLLEYIQANESKLNDGSSLIPYFTDRSYTSVFGDTRYIDSFGYVSVPLSVLTGLKTNGTQGIWPVGQFRLVRGSTDYQFFFSPPNKDFNWLNGKPPPGEPKCGFDGEKCRFLKDDTGKFVAIGAVVAAVVILGLASVVRRHYQFEKQLHSMMWKISAKDLLLQNANETLASAKSINSQNLSILQSRTSLALHKSHISFRDYQRRANREFEIEQKVQRKKKKNLFQRSSGDSERERLLNCESFETAIFKGNLVGLRKVYKNSIELNRNVKLELKQMREIANDNLTLFVGAVYEPPLIFIVSNFNSRGALKDILENDEMKLETMFISSIVLDILKGLKYLHESPILFHGRLKSSNCLVDVRFVVQLSGFGLREFRSGEQEPLTNDQKCRNLLWTAPEILRQESSENLGSQKGDIYSIAIVLHEIFGRRGPFGDEMLDAVETIQKVKHPTANSIYYRPSMNEVDTAPEYVKETMKICWDEAPEQRPAIGEINKLLKPLQSGMKTNLLENLLEMLEHYTNNLEHMVDERTHALMDEKRKCDNLLLRMLPKFVAEQLKHGHAVQAETFESVSVYFSDVVGFTVMASESTPLEIVTFLNDLYTCFDAIIERYDVYKVETIGSSYMVSSGLPEHNGNNHAGEVASMALQMLDSVKTFKIRHRPDEPLTLRIGIHSGVCVAGVVGLKMPRYCLFGDTVNTAARLQSHGEVGKIHSSLSCKILLDALGGYVTVERGKITMKGKGEHTTYWVLSEDHEFRKTRLIREAAVFPSLKRHYH